MPKVLKIDGKLNLCGDLIKEARLRQGISRKKLARMMCEHRIYMSESSIYRIETGKRRLKLVEYAVMTRVLELDTNEIQETILQRLKEIQARKNKHIKMGGR